MIEKQFRDKVQIIPVGTIGEVLENSLIGRKRDGLLEHLKNFTGNSHDLKGYSSAVPQWVFCACVQHIIEAVFMLEEPLPLFRKTQLTYTNADLNGSTDDLWQIHDRFAKGGQHSDGVVSPSLLDLKIEIAQRKYQNSQFCERRCLTDRIKRPGFCGVLGSKYSSEFLHYGEERELVPSHTIFFTGCTFKCVFCQNRDIAYHPNAGVVCDPQVLARRIYARSMAGSRNVNWVGGDPTPHICMILETTRALATLERESGVDARLLNVPMVFNSNAYYSTEAHKLLDGVIDVY